MQEMNFMKDETQNVEEASLNQLECDEKEFLPRVKFGYKRLFPKAEDLPSDIKYLMIKNLELLGTAMVDENNVVSDSNIPAGYTYLGQFIDHEISRAVSVISEDEPINVDFMVNDRSPFFDLESIYGKGPICSPELYRSNTLLRVGITEGENTGGVKKQFCNDLPRKTKTSLAEIIDDRNDENLIVAQTQVAFIKFHNAVVNSLKDDNSLALFKEAREIVIRHFQWLVLYDFLPRIIEKTVSDNVSENGNKYYFPTPQKPNIPIEFAGAAFRFGHSMVRISYEWNKVFSTTGTKSPLDLFDLMVFTGLHGLNLSKTEKREHLPSAWVVDWRRFFELPNPNGVKPNHACQIDTVLAPLLGNFPASSGVGSLSFRNLHRGFSLNLPTGQTVAKSMGVTALTPTQLNQVLPASLQLTFNTETPLWYYILAEAKLQGQGETLGEIGSRIVAESIFGLIKISPISILRDSQWKPTLGQTKPEEFRMPDLLKFVASQSRFGDAELNPIGD